jgi:RNA polymerase sigma-70 factor (ECF subfamily)
MTSASQFDIEALRRGNKKVFEKIYNEFSDMLYHLCLQYVNSESVAEELVQDAFVKLWEVKEGINIELGIRNYLYTITKNNCLMYLRKEQAICKNTKELKYIEMQFNYEALNVLADDVIQFDELRERLDDVIDQLPENLKEVFVLSRIDELKYREIADKLNISIKTVEARMSKALAILRQELKDYLPALYAISTLLS